MRAELRSGVGFLALAATLTTSACIPLDNALAAIFGRHMRDQNSFDPYENTLLPAEGSIPFAAGNLPAQQGDLNVGQPEPVEYDLPPFTVQTMPAVASALQNPVPSNPASLERGQVMYERFCLVCHGETGVGAQAPIAPAYGIVAGFNLATGTSVNQPDGMIYGKIRVGGPIMPPYGHQVSHFDRWHIVNYVRELQRQAGAGG